MRHLAVLVAFAIGMTLALATEAQQAAPDFALKSAHGENYRLSEHRGRVVVLNFWATWCQLCLRTVPRLATLRRNLPEQDVVVFAISLDGDSRRAADMSKAWDLGLPVLFDSEQAVIKRYGVTNVPSAVLIDRDGRVRHVEENADSLYALNYRRQLEALVEE